MENHWQFNKISCKKIDLFELFGVWLILGCFGSFWVIFGHLG